jgi:type I restriction enzyme S subunit
LDFKNLKYISKEEHEKISRRVKPQKDDVLMAKSGTLGVAAIVEDDTEFSIYESLALLRPRKEIVLPRYLYYILNSKHTHDEKNASSKGMGVKHLHLTEIDKITIPVPVLPEQQKIINKLDAEMVALEKVRFIKSLASERVVEIIQNIWQS